MPALQAVQPAAPDVPLPVTAPAKPGAQIVQAATDALPAAKPVVVMPAGQAVQLGELKAAYVPAAHTGHDALAVPLPVTVPA